MDPETDGDWMLTVVHEVGHAIVAMHYGAPGRLEFDLGGDALGGCLVEHRHEPTGRAGVHYGYAGAAAELLWHDWSTEGATNGSDEERFKLLGILAWPSAEDFALIGDTENVRAEIARTKAEFIETCGILRADWPHLLDMVAHIVPCGKRGVHWFIPGVPFHPDPTICKAEGKQNARN